MLSGAVIVVVFPAMVGSREGHAVAVLHGNATPSGRTPESSVEWSTRTDTRPVGHVTIGWPPAT